MKKILEPKRKEVTGGLRKRTSINNLLETNVARTLPVAFTAIAMVIASPCNPTCFVPLSSHNFKCFQNIIYPRLIRVTNVVVSTTTPCLHSDNLPKIIFFVGWGAPRTARLIGPSFLSESRHTKRNQHTFFPEGWNSAVFYRKNCILFLQCAPCILWLHTGLTQWETFWQTHKPRTWKVRI